MFALLAAALIQTGAAFNAMNGVVRSHHQITVAPQSDEAAVLTTPPVAAPAKESLAVAAPAGRSGS